MGTIYIKKAEEEQIPSLSSLTEPPKTTIQQTTSMQSPFEVTPAQPPMSETPSTPIQLTPGIDDPENHHFTTEGFPGFDDMRDMELRGESSWVGAGGNGAVYHVPGYGVVKYAFHGGTPGDKAKQFNQAEEYNIAKKMGDLGVGPKVHGVEWSQNEPRIPVKIGMEYLHEHIPMDVFLESEKHPSEMMPEERDDYNKMVSNFYDNLFRTARKMHEAGIAHRDVKPDNILVSSSGKPRFIDFGAATSGNYMNVLEDAIDNEEDYWGRPGLTDMFIHGTGENEELQDEITDLVDKFKDFYYGDDFTDLARDDFNGNKNEAAKSLVHKFYEEMFDALKEHGRAGEENA